MIKKITNHQTKGLNKKKRKKKVYNKYEIVRGKKNCLLELDK